MSSLLYEGKSDRLPFRYSRYYFFSRNRNYFLITSSIENNFPFWWVVRHLPSSVTVPFRATKILTTL